ncbi:protein-cysteine N-palmitoyltransferase HHAT [Trichonephila clavipes]|nr:protein-cysteine N-palmitoyltransferase HHAT [Trichonephila clavipes]
MPCSDLRMHADNSDVEWLILTSTFKKFYMLFLFQVICTNIILRVNRTITPFFYTVFSVISLSLIIGYAAAAVFIFYPSLMYIFHTFHRKSLCYMMTICALFFIHHPLFNFIRVNIPMGDSESFLFDVGIAWLILKSLSFAIDRIDSKKTSCGMSIFTDIFCVLSYSLYLPVLFTGPIITYETFCNQMLKTAQPLPLKELIHRFLLLVRHILWYFVYEFLLHYIYSHAVQFYPDAVQNYDSFALCGLGYALPKMFFLKYYIIYGVSKCISKLEDIELPPPPKCISCVHLSSELWRHFDRGLYLWILKYLYLPAGGARVHDVASEIAVKFFLTTETGKLFKTFSPGAQTRISAAFATPHFLMMCISCCFFLSNFHIGMLIIKRVVLGGITPLGPLLLIMYCGCHVSISWKEHQQNSKPVIMYNKSS